MARVGAPKVLGGYIGLPFTLSPATHSSPTVQHTRRRGDSRAATAATPFVVERATVAYYEVTIGAPNAAPASGPDDEWTQRDCIAVGLGSAGFPLHGKQPGWDTDSFGYHSDDGVYVCMYANRYVCMYVYIVHL